MVRGFGASVFVNMAEWKEHECVFTYLTEKKYDEGTTKAEKRRIREKAQSFVWKTARLILGFTVSTFCLAKIPV